MGKYDFWDIQYDFKFEIVHDGEKDVRVELDHTQDQLENTLYQ